MMRQKGFTLLEMVITIAIMAILVRIALPSYRDYITRGKLTEATSNLSNLRVQLEQYYQDNRTYVAATCTLPSSVAKYFTYSCPTLTATTFTIRAAGITAQGTGGFTYEIYQNNDRATTAVPATSWGTVPATCWIVRKGGGCY